MHAPQIHSTRQRGSSHGDPSFGHHPLLYTAIWQQPRSAVDPPHTQDRDEVPWDFGILGGHSRDQMTSHLGQGRLHLRCLGLQIKKATRKGRATWVGSVYGVVQWLNPTATLDQPSKLGRPVALQELTVPSESNSPSMSPRCATTNTTWPL